MKQKLYDINCALIILYDNNHKILLQHRTKDAPILPNYWAFFGGGIKQHETPIEAVIRETKEELNYQLKNPILIYETEFLIDYKRGYMYVFAEKFLEDKNKLELREGQDWGWFDKKAIKKLKMWEFDKKILLKIIEKFK